MTFLFIDTFLVVGLTTQAASQQSCLLQEISGGEMRSHSLEYGWRTAWVEREKLELMGHGWGCAAYDGIQVKTIQFNCGLIYLPCLPYLIVVAYLIYFCSLFEVMYLLLHAIALDVKLMVSNNSWSLVANPNLASALYTAWSMQSCTYNCSTERLFAWPLIADSASCLIGTSSESTNEF